MFKSIRGRLILTYIIVICVTMLIISIFLLNILEDYYLDYQRETMSNAGKLVAEIATVFVKNETDLVALSSLTKEVSRQINARVIIVDRRGLVLGDSVRAGGLLGRQLNRPEIENALRGDIGSSIQYSAVTEQRIMQVALPVLEADEIIGVVFLASSLEDVYEILRMVGSFLVMATLLSLVLAGFLATFLSKTVTNPIKELTEATREMAAGQLEQKIVAHNRDEIGQLAGQFNIMALKVTETNKRLREFVANASHELRTPLTTINLLVASLKDHASEKEIRDEFIKDIDKETQRLIKLVEDLLNLARLERKGNVLLKEPLDLIKLARETAASVVRLVEAQGVSLSCVNREENIEIMADEEKIKQVMLNLLDNAVKNTLPRGYVRLEVRKEAGFASVLVTDTGCGIPPHDLERIFQRFYRVDKARSREHGGTGLGLAIAREIIKQHGGKIWAENRAEGGSLFCFTLPLSNIKKD